ncbi:tyrosine phenol-lyase [Pedobacter sp. HMWF019]|uniref:tryptophanase n=1 Tax=Pedobacter sp. HMWF019 TaxID=2056856 RepID=UPI000D360235|nr:tryptophanase [Pedobacter sp. HMWF019]PTS99632.1 tyrosine phenol-lyase [Pedobacter sp. HMWF019]
MRTIIEPFRIKSVEPIHSTTPEQRKELLIQAHYNPFLLKAKDVIIDLLTDSGTGAMSSEQWAGIMRGDESYAGSESFYRFESAVKNITGMPFIIPVHQGRAAEHILFTFKGGEGKYILSNTLFDTTRANIEFSGAQGLDLLCPEGKLPAVSAPFKGNIDTQKLRQVIEEKGKENISVVIVTVTNNSGGGQPVSMENIKMVRDICSHYEIPFFIDACRFAENAYFIKKREVGYQDKTIIDIAREMFSYADGCTMSAKKDAFANIGGFLALNDAKLAEQCRNQLVITEGFPTYGGLAGRDLEAIAIGLGEIVQEDYLHYRIRSIEYIAEKLDAENVPYLKPSGGHALYLDAKAFLPHIPVHEYPGQALAAALYLEGGIRGVEIGSVMFGKYDQQGKLVPATLELLRLAIPRRTYTQSHMDYLLEVIINVYRNRKQIKGFEITYEAEYLRHFTAHFKPAAQK